MPNFSFRRWEHQDELFALLSKLNVGLRCLVDNWPEGTLIVGLSAQKANALNKHFCSVGDNIANKIDAAKTHFSAFLQNPRPNTFFLKQVEEYEVLQQIQNIKLKSIQGMMV